MFSRPDEVDFSPARAIKPKRVAVVGAGIAGMEAAWVAAARETMSRYSARLRPSVVRPGCVRNCQAATRYLPFMTIRPWRRGGPVHASSSGGS